MLVNVRVTRENRSVILGECVLPTQYAGWWTCHEAEILCFGLRGMMDPVDPVSYNIIKHSFYVHSWRGGFFIELDNEEEVQWLPEFRFYDE